MCSLRSPDTWLRQPQGDAVPEGFEPLFRSSPFLDLLGPVYNKRGNRTLTIGFFINRAKKEETKLKRRNQMLDELDRGGIYVKMPYPASRKR